MLDNTEDSNEQLFAFLQLLEDMQLRCCLRQHSSSLTDDELEHVEQSISYFRGIVQRKLNNVTQPHITYLEEDIFVDKDIGPAACGMDVNYPASTLRQLYQMQEEFERVLNC